MREALVASLEECDHLAQLAEDLLVVARTSEGELPVRPEPLELRELLERVAARFADRAGERGRTISVDADDGQSVYADELRLRQALGNLVDNALRYGAGEIVLRAARARHGLELEVSDQGEGFAPELRRARVRALRPRRSRSHPGRAAPASASRSCARSRRRTAAAPRSCRAPARRCGSGSPTGPEPPQGHLRLAGVASDSQGTNPIRGADTR